MTQKVLSVFKAHPRCPKAPTECVLEVVDAHLVPSPARVLAFFQAEFSKRYMGLPS